MSVPTIVAQAANASYTIIDRLFIGHIPEVGNAAMTGVGICFPILLAVTAFASLIGAGGAPRASIELGRGNFKKAERILGTSAAFLIAIAPDLTVLLQLAKRPILYAFGASDATIEYAVDFITIYLIGTVFVQLTLGLNNFISAQGKTTVAMVSVLIGTGISILLDPVFIFVFGWGVRGAAAANVLAQLVSTIWIVLFLSSGRSAIRLRPLNIRFDRIIIPVLALGLAPFIMQITECLINVVFNVGLQRYGGDDYVTSITIITSLMQIVSVLTSGFQQGIQPIIGFNFGARHMERVRQAVRMAFVTQIVSATALVSVLATFPGFFASWFTSEQTVIDIVTRMMPIFVCGWGIFGIQMARNAHSSAWARPNSRCSWPSSARSSCSCRSRCCCRTGSASTASSSPNPSPTPPPASWPASCSMPPTARFGEIWSRLLIQWMCRLMRCKTRTDRMPRKTGARCFVI